ncbi:DUF3429 domain-containing protein [Pseudohalioglobus sediminis]|uniref:DUF3429 domain-containing protein n=1 Tax=Pseudohalioglobus sediminis TaxID=2606449 RepID=UPI00165F3533|nr:DUF3429 domain-containing protein [Pseudohalioglobus sediminis]
MSGTLVQSPSVPATATWLGRAGLAPFLALPAGMLVDSARLTLWSNLLSAYAFGILTFLLGAWWGIALLKRYTSVLVLSNVLFLLLLSAFVLMPAGSFFLAAATCFFVVLWTERRHALFAPQPDYYARLRLQLSSVASAALIIAAMLSWNWR